MILCVGEILADMIGQERNGTFCYERRAGGAPFNVACAASRFGAEVGFVGNVGDDLIGDFLLDFAGKRGIQELSVTRDGTRNTTLAFVQLSAEGERSFCFYRRGTADYYLPAVSDEQLSSASLLHVGSLMLSEEVGRTYARDLFKRARALHIPISFDINFRSDIFRNVEAAKEIYREFMAEADLVKLSEDEVEIFGEEAVKDICRDKLLFVTLGAAGSRCIGRGRTVSAPSIPVKVVDTTGAGDAFWGGILASLDGTSLDALTEEQITSTLRFANIAGALNTCGLGAIDSLPTREDILSRL